MSSSAKAGKSRPVYYTNDQIISAATGRWAEVVSEVKASEPYVINRPDAEAIVISPLTRRRRKALKSAQAAYLMVGAQLAEAQNEGTANQSTLSRIQQVLEEAETEYDKALFGEAFDAVYDYYEDLQEEFWDAMYQDVHDRLVNRVQLPSDTCPKCGRKDEDEEGKEQSSSTLSNDTGTSLKAISADT